jgi:hypothetical protein
MPTAKAIATGSTVHVHARITTIDITIIDVVGRHIMASKGKAA